MNDTHTPQPMPADQIRADRACIGCGFNLFGQSVTKEEHYGLAIARCPECGTVAALQQYPVMTHWVNRFRLIFAAIYILILLGAFVGSTIAISAFAFGASNVASRNLGSHLSERLNGWYEAQNIPQNTVGGVSYWSSNLTPAFVRDELPQALDDFGSFWGGMDQDWVIVMVPAMIVCFGIGVFWSIALLGSSRTRALIVPLISCVIGGVFIIAANRPDYNNAWIWSLAHQLYIPTLVPVVILIEFIAISVGVWAGRTLARLAVCLALPTRARVPLSILWTRDGLELPRPSCR